MSKACHPFKPPANWKELFCAVRDLRRGGGAPVDTIGCDRLYDPVAPRSIQRYQILLSLMLSSQTRDQVTAAAMHRLRYQVEGGCTPQAIVKIQHEALAELLTPVSFYNNKARYIKEATSRILDEFHGEVPSELEDVLKLPGVGPKMAHLFMQAADGKVLGIGVDVHVHRIARRFRWTPESVRTPEDSRAALESWLPREHWSEINHLLVGFGQTICTPRNPKCNTCALNALCPNAFKENTTTSTSGAGGKKKQEKEETRPLGNHEPEHFGTAVTRRYRRCSRETEVSSTECKDVEDLMEPAKEEDSDVSQKRCVAQRHRSKRRRCA